MAESKIERIVDGILGAARPITAIGVVEFAFDESDPTTAFVGINGITRECAILDTTKVIRKGQRVKVRSNDGGSTWEIIGVTWAEDTVSGVFDPTSEESPFAPVDRRTYGPINPPTSDPQQPGTKTLNRDPGNTYDYGSGETIPPAEPTRPVPPRDGGGGRGAVPETRFPNGFPIPYGTNVQSLNPELNESGSRRRVASDDHVHGHGELPVNQFGENGPHAGYSLEGHTHTNDPVDPDLPPDPKDLVGQSFTESLTVQIVDDATLLYTTTHVYLADSLQVSWNGQVLEPDTDYTEDVENQQFTLVGVQPLLSEADTLVVYYMMDASAAGYGNTPYGEAAYGS